MLSLVLKAGDKIRIGDNVVIKLKSDRKTKIAIDAPREVTIERIEAEKREKKIEHVN